MKVQVSLDDELMKRVDNAADENYMSRSGLISVALTQYLNQVDMVKALVDVSVSMRKIADTGKVEHDVIEKLEDFERLARFVAGNK